MVMKMKKMNKKVLKLFSYLVLFTLLFSINYLSVNAKDKELKVELESGSNNLFKYDVARLTFYSGVVGTCKNDVCEINYGENELSLPESAVKKPNITGHEVHYRVFKESSTNEQLYCIEQGVAFSKSGVSSKALNTYLFVRKTPGIMTNSSECENKNTTTEISCETKYREKLIAQVISVGYHNTDPKSSDFNQYKNIATQELIWEIARGERNVSSFSNSTYMPNKTCNTKKTVCPFYTKLFTDSSTKNNSKVIKVRNAYKDIIDKVYYTYYKTPSSFATKQSSAKTVKLSTYNSSTKKYSVTLTNNEYKNYKNFKFSTNNKNVSVSLKNNKLTITSTKPLTSAVLITANYKYENNLAKLKDNEDWSFTYVKRGTGNNVYDQQAVATGAAQATYYLKVITPTYSIKINKIDHMTGGKLSNVKFNICYNACGCKNPTVVTTNGEGEATLSKITTAGKYCIQEKEQVDGYVSNTEVEYVNLQAEGEYVANFENEPYEFELTKQIISGGKASILNDGCGTNNNRAKFQLKDSKGNIVSFVPIGDGEYNANFSDSETTTESLVTCNGKIKIYTLKKGKYTITETEFPENVQKKENSKEINITASKSKYYLTMTNGFAGLEFQKKDEDGTLILGGKFSLQMKVNNIYKDVLLLKKEDGMYNYSSNLKTSDANATYELVTNEGIFRVSDLPVGEYRVVEKEAPEGYEVVKDRDSKAIAKITDSNKSDYVVVEMINKKSSKEGDTSSAELILTVITGRKIINYVYVFGALTILIVLLIYLRKKIKK